MADNKNAQAQDPATVPTLSDNEITRRQELQSRFNSLSDQEKDELKALDEKAGHSSFPADENANTADGRVEADNRMEADNP